LPTPQDGREYTRISPKKSRFVAEGLNFAAKARILGGLLHAENRSSFDRE